ncbi:MAG: molybdopterin-dependent oxidoreductase, partial [Chloroflexi bacterium]|nr:molybdopterin-dependent oxidoreductase [Chloroflexota bacterium]
PPYVGRGISLSYKDEGEGVSSAAVSFRPHGTVLLHTSVVEQGTGSYTALVQIVGEALGVAPERIEVQAWDSDDGPFDTGVGASRVTRVAGPAAYEAAISARAALLQLATRLLGWPADRIALSGDAVRRTDTGESASWAALVAQADTPVTGSATNNEHEPSPVASAMAQVAEVRVDPETGRVELLKLTSAHDVGVIINPIGHQGQINGGVVQGIGHALTEELMLQDGRVVNPTLADYKLPSIADLPELRTALVESEEGVGPYRTKGIGEYAIEGISAAVANAVADAVGVRIADAPVTAEKVYRALRERERQG